MTPIRWLYMVTLSTLEDRLEKHLCSGDCISKMRRIISICIIVIMLIGCAPTQSTLVSSEYSSENSGNGISANDHSTNENLGSRFNEIHIDTPVSSYATDSMLVPITLFTPIATETDASKLYQVENITIDFIGFSLSFLTLDITEDAASLSYIVEMPAAWDKEMELWNRTLNIKVLFDGQETDAFRKRVITPLEGGHSFLVTYNECTLSWEKWQKIGCIELVPDVILHDILFSEGELKSLSNGSIIAQTTGRSYAQKSNSILGGSYSHTQIDALKVSITVNENRQEDTKLQALHPITVWNEDYEKNEMEGRYLSREDSAEPYHGSYRKISKDFSKCKFTLSRLQILEEGAVIELHLVFPDDWSTDECRSMFHWLASLRVCMEINNEYNTPEEIAESDSPWLFRINRADDTSDSLPDDPFTDVYFTLIPSGFGFGYDQWKRVETITFHLVYRYCDSVGDSHIPLSETPVYDGGFPRDEHQECINELSFTVNLDDTVFSDGI